MPGGVEVGATRGVWGDVAVIGTAVGDVDGLKVRGYGNAVGLDEGVFDEVGGAGGGTEAIYGRGELGRGVG